MGEIERNKKNDCAVAFQYFSFPSFLPHNKVFCVLSMQILSYNIYGLYSCGLICLRELFIYIYIYMYILDVWDNYCTLKKILKGLLNRRMNWLLPNIYIYFCYRWPFLWFWDYWIWSRHSCSSCAYSVVVVFVLFCFLFFVFHTLQYTIFLRPPQKGREARKESKFHLWGLKYEKKFLKNKKYTKIQDWINK